MVTKIIYACLFSLLCRNIYALQDQSVIECTQAGECFLRDNNPTEASAIKNQSLREILAAPLPWKEKRLHIASMIKDGNDPNTKQYVGYYEGTKLCDYGPTALSEAIENNDCGLAKFLLTKGACLECDRPYFSVPPFFGARTVRMAEVLFEYGKPDINELAPEGTVLHYLAKRKISGEPFDYELFSFYLKQGVNPEKLDNSGEMVLQVLLKHEHVYASDEYLQVIKELMRRIIDNEKRQQLSFFMQKQLKRQKCESNELQKRIAGCQYLCDKLGGALVCSK